MTPTELRTLRINMRAQYWSAAIIGIVFLQVVGNVAVPGLGGIAGGIAAWFWLGLVDKHTMKRYRDARDELYLVESQVVIVVAGVARHFTVGTDARTARRALRKAIKITRIHGMDFTLETDMGPVVIPGREVQRFEVTQERRPR